MNWWLGLLLVAVPFGLLFWACVRNDGWKLTTVMFLMATTFAGLIHLGTRLMQGFE